jgi:hypothetical protein
LAEISAAGGRYSEVKELTTEMISSVTKQQFWEQRNFWGQLRIERTERVLDQKNGMSYIVSLAGDSRYLKAQLGFCLVDNGRKARIHVSGECLGVLPVMADRPVELDRRAPVLNYGPTMESLIEQTLDAGEPGQLSDLLLDGVGFSLAFKPLEHYARCHFPGATLPLPRAIKLIGLLLEGVGLIEHSDWYSREEKDLLLASFSARNMTSSVKTNLLLQSDEVLEILAGTVQFARRWRAPFSNRQFVVIAQLYQRLADVTGIPLEKDALQRIRQAHYS